jgi:hypothetical protein
VAAQLGDDLLAFGPAGARGTVAPGLAHYSIADLVAGRESGDAHV